MTALLFAIALAAVSGIPGLISRRAGERIASALLVVSSVIGLRVAFDAMSEPASFSLPWSVPGGELAFRVDGLAALFLVPLFIVAPLGSLYGLEYWPERDHPRSGRKLRLFYGLLTAAIALLLVARNAVLFLVGWETMALAAFFCITAEDERASVRQSGYVYLVATRIGTLLLFAMFAVLHAAAGSWDFSAPKGPMSWPAATAVFVLALLGFGLKAGLMPLHVWLPGAHADSPSHVSALMSGVMIKTGIYGIARVCSFFDAPPLGWGAALLLIGSVSGVLGVAFAMGQHDLKRLLAYHSVENIGIILMGLGVAMLGRSIGSPALVALGMAGSLLHVCNHALFKSLLFFGAGSVLHATGTREIDRLGGLAKPMPRTAAAFAFGAIAICGLPPLNGFVSELFVYLGLLRAAPEEKLWVMSAVGVPALALIGALALACFVKAYGAVFLGRPRSELSHRAHEAGFIMTAPMVALAAACAFIGLAPVGIAPLLQTAILAWAPEEAAAAPSLEDLAPLQILSITGAALLVLTLVGGAWLARVTRKERTAVGPTWGCGFIEPSPRMQYTASSFAETLVTFFSWALRPSVQVQAPAGLFPAPTSFHSHVGDTVLERAVLPVSRAATRALRWFRWMQHGNIHLYLVYILATLLVLLVAAR